MAFRAGQTLVAAGEWKCRVVEFSWLPSRWSMALTAAAGDPGDMPGRSRVAGFAAGILSLVFPAGVALAAAQEGVDAGQQAGRMRFVARITLVGLDDLRLAWLGMHQPRVAIGTQHIFHEVQRMLRLSGFIWQNRRVGVTGEALVVFHPQDDFDRHGVVAAEMGCDLFCTAHFFGDVTSHAWFSVAVGADRFWAVSRVHPGGVVEIHLVTAVAEPGLFVHTLKTCPGKHQQGE
jgi:hypothetical protein